MESLRVAYFDRTPKASPVLKFIDADPKIADAKLATTAKILAVSSAFTCILTAATADGSDMYIHQFNYNTGTVVSEKFLDVQANGTLPADVLTATWAVANNCNNVRLAGNFWIKNASVTGAGKFRKNVAASAWTVDASTPGSTFILSSQPKLYRFNVSTLSYVDTGITLNNSFFKTGVRSLLPSDDNTKVIINSAAVNGANYDFAFEIYSYKEPSWSKVHSQTNSSIGGDDKSYIIDFSDDG